MSKILKMNLFKFKLTKRYGGNIRVFYSQRKSKNFKHSHLLKKEKITLKKLRI